MGFLYCDKSQRTVTARSIFLKPLRAHKAKPIYYSKKYSIYQFMENAEPAYKMAKEL